MSRQRARRNNVSNFQCEQLVHVGERRHQTHARLHERDAGRFEVLLLETLLNPVHAQVVNDLLHNTLQHLALGENQDLGDASRLLQTHPPSTIQEPTLGSWAAPWTRIMFVASSLCTVVPVGAWVAHTKEATLHGQIGATTPERVSPIIGPVALPLPTPG